MAILIGLLYITSPLLPYQLFPVGGYGFTTNDLTILLILLAGVKHVFWDGKTMQLAFSLPLAIVLCLPILFLFSSTSTFIDGFGYVQFLKTFIHWLYLWLLAVVLAGIGVSADDIRKALRIYIVFAVVVAIFGIYQIFARAFDLPFAWLEITNIVYAGRGGEVSDAGQFEQLSLQFENFYRATSFFSEPSVLAGFNNFTLLVLVLPVIQKTQPIIASRIIRNLVLFIVLVCQLLTFSLTGVLLGASMVFLALCIEPVKTKISILKGIGVAMLLVVSVSAAIQPLTEINVFELFSKRVTNLFASSSGRTFSNTDGESSGYRFKGIGVSVEIWEDYPISGIGMGNFSRSPLAQREEYAFSTTTYSSVLTETGVIGFSLVIVLFASLFITTLTYYFRYQNGLTGSQQFVVGFLPYIATELVVGSISANAFTTQGPWIAIGVIFAIMASVQSGNIPHQIIIHSGIKPLRTYIGLLPQKK